MRVAILSDTHGMLDPRVARAAAGADLTVHAGDVGCAAVLEAIDGPLVAIRGNNDTRDRWPVDDVAVLEALSDQADVDLPGGRLVIVHGDRAGPVSSRHRRLREQFPDARAVVYGHSHRRCVDTGGRPWVLNPGAAGRARTYGGPSLLLLTANVTRWRVREVVFDPLASRGRGGGRGL